jgi:selenocysteine-specific translation elongation factor
LIFNKVDLLDTKELEEKKKYILNYYDEKEVFFTSAVGNIGIEDLKKKIFYEITKNS